MERMSVDDKLGLDKFTTDEKHPHIRILEKGGDKEMIRRLIQACPAGLYHEENGTVIFSHEGCLECGTCRVLCGGTIVQSWEYPDGEWGVEYRKG